jgi:hypothetical protein
MGWLKRNEDASFVASRAVATLTVQYSCGHSAISSIVATEDETRYNSCECAECWKSTHRLLQEGQSLADFVTESTSPRKRGWR